MYNFAKQRVKIRLRIESILHSFVNVYKFRLTSLFECTKRYTWRYILGEEDPIGVGQNLLDP